MIIKQNKVMIWKNNYYINQLKNVLKNGTYCFPSTFCLLTDSYLTECVFFLKLDFFAYFPVPPFTTWTTFGVYVP